MKKTFWCVALSCWVAVSIRADGDAPVVLADPDEFSISLDDELSLAAIAEPVAWLGLGLQEMDLLESVVTAEGVRIADLAPLAPAKEAGLKKEDVLTHWNDEPVTSAAAVQERIAHLKVGEVRRRGKGLRKGRSDF